MSDRTTQDIIDAAASTKPDANLSYAELTERIIMLKAEIAAMRPVVTAAVAWSKTDDFVGYDRGDVEKLHDAVDAYRELTGKP